MTELINTRPSEEKIDLSIIGDGYRMSERSKFIGDTRRAMQYLFSTAPYSEHQRAFNVRAVFVASGTSGILARLSQNGGAFLTQRAACLVAMHFRY